MYVHKASLATLVYWCFIFNVVYATMCGQVKVVPCDVVLLRGPRLATSASSGRRYVFAQCISDHDEWQPQQT